MEALAGGVAVHYVEHGAGRPVVVLHGAGVDHREPEACFEPVFAGLTGFRRIYPDLPGMGRTAAPAGLRSAEDVLDTLVAFAAEVTEGAAHLVVGHSAGGYFAQAMAGRVPGQVAGLALVCPLLPRLGEVPDHRAVVASAGIGDDSFRSYFVVQTPEMLERYERYVAPGAALIDQAALERIGERWELPSDGPPYPGPTLLVAGRLDSTVGYAAATDLAHHYPHASLAVVDDTGHALPHEQPGLLRALVAEWLARESSARPGIAATSIPQHPGPRPATDPDRSASRCATNPLNLSWEKRTWGVPQSGASPNTTTSVISDAWASTRSVV
jgi:pimeloyl-ACP methyl ester carboxylesterase